MEALDRKQMEADRLARQAKKRGADSQSESVSEEPHKVQRREKASRRSPERSTAPLPLGRSSEATTAASDRASPSVRYPEGTIKRTWCFNQARDGMDIKLEEVLEKSTLSVAVISSWQLDTQYLFSKLGAPQITAKLYLIMHSKHESDQEQWRREASQLSNNIRLCFPKLPPGPGGVMHSKLMLLFHPEKLRIVVPSANMMDYDWGETGVMENVVFLVDLPRLSEDKHDNDNDTITSFTIDLIAYLEAQGVSQDVRDAVLKFDFSRTAHLAWASTVVGTHIQDDEEIETGLPQLAAAVKSLGAEASPFDAIDIDYTTGSVGKLDSQIFEHLEYAFRGWNLYNDPKGLEEDTTFRIHFPSLETVTKSIGGTNSAGTLFFAPQKTDSTAAEVFGRMRDGNSTRKGLLSHAKMAIARTSKHVLVYVGSANTSQAAWGKWTEGRAPEGRKKGTKTKLVASNWECGVVMKLDVDGESDKKKVIPIDKIKDKIPIMFDIPGEEYVTDGEVKKPWMVKGG